MKSQTSPISQLVSITAKIVKIEEPAKVTTKDGKVLQKQDTTIADATNDVRLVLREDVGILEINKSSQILV